MTSPRSCELGRMIGCHLWQRRHDLHWPLEHVAKLSGVSVGRVMGLELCADDDDDLSAVCRALNLHLGEVLARATGHILLANLPAPWDEPVAEDDDGPIPF